MKKLLCLILLVACYICTGYAQHYAWAKKGGNPSNYDYSNNIATDAAGNSYTVGTFYGTSTFGSFTLTSAGTSSAPDIYVLKQNAAGVVQWAKRAGSPSDDAGLDITIDSNGDIIIAGIYLGTADFDATTTITWHSGSTSYNMFIAKYSSSTGNLVWAKSLGGTYGGQIGKIKADQWGNFYLSGSFTGVSYFGTDSVTSTLNGNDGFVCKFDSNGDEIWLKSIKGNTSDDVALTTAVDLSGNVFVSGNFRSDTLFVGNSYVVNTDVTMSSSDCFIAKYNSAGGFQWVKTINGNGQEYAPASDVDSSGNFYLTGRISDATNFDTITVYDSGNGDSFLAKYDPAGSCVWVRQSTGLGEEEPSSVHVSSNGRISIIGSFYDYGTWGNYSFTSDINGNSDMFIAQYDQDGNVRWAMNATGPQDNYGIGLSPDALNNLYLTGYYSGNMVMGSTTLPGFSYLETFVAKIDMLNAGIISSPNCAGSAVTVPYLGTITFNAGNVFTAQLSDASGSFSSPVNIGTLTSVVNSGTINAIIPISSPTSNNYRIRVTSSNPAVVGSWANDFTIAAGAETPSICMVTADDESIDNIILWDKTFYTNVDSFIVYREVSTANYKRIGSVSIDSMSQFIDTARSIGPANGDPNVGSYRYKLQIRDLCGNYGALSPYHNTIYIIDAGLGQFTWNVPYAIEGGANPVNNYVLLCDTANTDIWLPVGTVAGTQTSATDPGFSNHSTIANWRVKTLWSIACDPTRTTVNTSRSNIKHASSITTGISDAVLNSIAIYPNPATDLVSIEIRGTMQKGKIVIMNAIGQTVYEQNVVSGNAIVPVNTSSFAKGIYTVIIENNNQKIVKKLVLN